MSQNIYCTSYPFTILLLIGKNSFKLYRFQPQKSYFGTTVSQFLRSSTGMIRHHGMIEIGSETHQVAL